MKSERIHYIDIAKAFGIIAIVMGHIYGVGVVRHVLYAFHVPLFFFLSAIFLNSSKPMWVILKEKVKTIMLPYYIVSLISIVIYSVLGNYVAHALGKNMLEFADNSITDNLVGMLYGNSRTGMMNWNRPLWFLPCLFATILLFEVLEKYVINRRNTVRFLTLLGTIGGGYLLSRINVILPFQLECSISMLTWMELALLIKPYILEINENQLNIRGVPKILGAFVMFIVAIITCIKNEIVDVRINYYGNYVCYLVSASLFILLILCCAKAIGENHILEFLGQNTMVILLFHKFPILFFQSVFGPTKIYLQDLQSFKGTICAIFVGILTIMSCLILSEIGRKLRRTV